MVYTVVGVHITIPYIYNHSVCGAGASPLAQRLFCCVLRYDETAGRQGKASRMRHGVWMGIQYASRSKVVVVFLPAFIASIAILLAGWLRVLRLTDWQQSYIVASLALTHLVYISES